MNNLQQQKRQSGFTLIEIAIVLVIIGLLLGGVLQGQQLIENSRVRAATNNFNGIAAAAFSYQDRYGRLPGDDGPTATLTARGGSWTVVTGGNANGSLTALRAETFAPGLTSEVDDFFQHLRAAGFIPGNANLGGTSALPQNDFGGLIGLTTEDVGGGLAGTKICMSNVPGSSSIALDTQLDDGNSDTGRFRSTVGTDAAPDNAGTTGAYVENNVYTVCYRI